MAKHFSELPAATLPLVGTEIVPLEEVGGINKKCTIADIKGLPATQIVFGDGSNLMTSSNDFTYDEATGIFSVGVNGAANLIINPLTDYYYIKNAGTRSLFESLGTSSGYVDIGDCSGDIGIGDKIRVDIGNSLAYYDNAVHTGKFGVNTSSPSAALDVFGSINGNSVDNPEALVIRQDGNPRFVVDNSNSYTYSLNNNFGINTFAPTVALEVVGGSKFIVDDGYEFIVDNTNGAGTKFAVIPGSDKIYVTNDAANTKFGINTSIPDSALHVVGNVNFSSIPQYANRTAALAGGLTAGMMYSLPISGDNKVICIV